MRATIARVTSRHPAVAGVLLGLAALLCGAPAAQATPQIDVGATSLVFPGPVMVGMGTSEQHFRLTNVGTSRLRLVRWKLDGAVPPDFQVAGCSLFQGFPVNLQPGEWCDVYVSFQPKAPGPRSAILAVESNDPLRPRVEVELSGNATGGAPDIRVTPGALSFGVRPLNTCSAPLAVTVQSAGPAPLTITGVSVSDPRFTVLHNCGVLAAVNSGLTPLACTVEVRFCPMASGPVPGQLTIASDDPQGPVVVALSGVGGGPVVGVVSSIDIGSVFVGSQSTPREVVIQNLAPAGTGRLHVSSATFGGPHAADFSASPIGSCADVVEGGSCSLEVTFRPRSTGTRSAVLSLISDAGGVPGAVTNVSVTGTGVFAPTSLPPPPAATSDRDFTGVGNSGTCNGAATEFQLDIPVTRAFGSRNPLPAGATGQPSLGAAVASGALNPTATLELMTLEEGAPGRHFVLLGSFSAVLEPSAAPPPGQWALRTVTFPATSVGFPPVAPIGSAPTPLPNRVTIRPDANAAGSCLSVAWARLRVKVLSPVVFVHGNASNGAFFVRQGIAGALNARGVPNDTSLNLPVASIAANAASLQAAVPRIVRSFGVDSVHLVTHSKGGLDARLWLSVNGAGNAAMPGGFQVLSLTTLATPHRGSPLADLQMAIAGAQVLVAGFPTASLGALGVPVAGAATPDLTTWASDSFNPPLPPGADHRMLAFNADALPDLFILRAPTDEYAPARAEMGLAGNAGTDALATTFHGFLLTTQRVAAVPLPMPVPLPVPIVGPLLGLTRTPVLIPGLPSFNDLLVRADSALGAPAPFVPALGPGASTLIGDHAAMSGPVGTLGVLPGLLTTDRTRGDLR